MRVFASGIHHDEPMRPNRKRCALLFLAFAAFPCWADGMSTPDRKAAAASQATQAKATPAKPAGPDDISAPAIRHVAVCPPPKLAPCAMKRPIVGGYRVLTSGIDIADDGANWVVNFGRGPKGALFLIQVMDARGSLHDIEVSFRSKPGMQKTPTLPEE